LLDTCAFIWAVADQEQLSATARAAITNPENDVLLSAASVWEIVIKHGAGRLSLTMDPATFVQEGRRRHVVDSLPIDEESVLHTVLLPPHHNDPFDRILIGQAIVHGCVLVTPDPVVRRYPVRSLW
jgi:PIN domain nuclease of toxin-antitoxin system